MESTRHGEKRRRRGVLQPERTACSGSRAGPSRAPRPPRYTGHSQHSTQPGILYAFHLIKILHFITLIMTSGLWAPSPQAQGFW